MGIILPRAPRQCINDYAPSAGRVISYAEIPIVRFQLEHIFGPPIVRAPRLRLSKRVEENRPRLFLARTYRTMVTLVYTRFFVMTKYSTRKRTDVERYRLYRVYKYSDDNRSEVTGNAIHRTVVASTKPVGIQSSEGALCERVKV